MIVIPDAAQVVPPRNLQKLLYDRDLIKSLARQMVASQVEAHLEMISDFGNEYSKFEEVNAAVQDARSTVVDYFNDLMCDFDREVKEAFKNVTIKVNTVSFEQDGLKDAEVEVL